MLSAFVPFVFILAASYAGGSSPGVTHTLVICAVYINCPFIPREFLKWYSEGSDGIIVS